MNRELYNRVYGELLALDERVLAKLKELRSYGIQFIASEYVAECVHTTNEKVIDSMMRVQGRYQQWVTNAET